MLELKVNQINVLKRAVASIANMKDSGAAIHFWRGGLLKILIALLRLLASGFDLFHCWKPCFINIDLTRFHQILNLATDEDSVTILFGHRQNLKTFRGDRTIKCFFKNLGTNQTRHYQMEFSRANFDPWDEDETQYKVAMEIPSKELSWVFSQLETPRKRGGDDLLYVSISNKRLRFFIFNHDWPTKNNSFDFSSKAKEITLTKEEKKDELHGWLGDQEIEGVHCPDYASSYTGAMTLSKTMWIFEADTDYTLMKCSIGKLGCLIFYLYRWKP